MQIRVAVVAGESNTFGIFDLHRGLLKQCRNGRDTHYTYGLFGAMAASGPAVQNALVQ